MDVLLGNKVAEREDHIRIWVDTRASKPAHMAQYTD